MLSEIFNPALNGACSQTKPATATCRHDKMFQIVNRSGRKMNESSKSKTTFQNIVIRFSSSVSV